MLITLLLKLAGFLQQVRRFSLVASCFNRDLHVLSSSDQVSNQERYEIPEDSSYNILDFFINCPKLLFLFCNLETSDAALPITKNHCLSSSSIESMFSNNNQPLNFT